MAYLINGNNLINFKGIITAAQMNTIGSVPLIFDTPANFYPIGFTLTVLSGTISPIFSSDLGVFCINNSVPLFLGSGPGFATTFFGFKIDTPGSTAFATAQFIDLTGPNFYFTVETGIDPVSPGDLEYGYNFYGYIL
jgi:hypothetical protein